MTPIITRPAADSPAETCPDHCVVNHDDPAEGGGLIHRSAVETVVSRLRFGTVDQTLEYEVSVVRAEGEPVLVFLDMEPLTPAAAGRLAAALSRACRLAAA